MYRSGISGWGKHADFIVIDLICMQLAYVMAYAIRFGKGGAWLPYTDLRYMRLAIYLGCGNLLVILLFRTYSGILRRSFLPELRKSVRHSITVVLGIALFLFSAGEGKNYSRTVICLTMAIYTVLLLFAKQKWKNAIFEMSFPSGVCRAVLIVCDGNNAEEVVKKVGSQAFHLKKVKAVAPVGGATVGEMEGVTVLSGLDGAVDYIKINWVDEVLIHCSSLGADVREFITRAERMGVVLHINLAVDHYGLSGDRIVEPFCGYTVLTGCPSIAPGFDSMMKDIIDIAGGLVGCAITLVLTVILAPIIYINSPGPVFFVQERIGKNGKRFKIYKFRSMYPDAEQKKQVIQDSRMMSKLNFDTRVIGNYIDETGNRRVGIGDFIRRTSLDEFPQFFNVLKGDMSLVGTRPPAPDEWEKYDLHHRARLSIKPGITGLWQVSGRSNITDFEEVVRLDTQYIREWSLLLDIRILLKTFKIVLSREGAI